MHPLRNDLERLKKYAQSLGIKVYFKPYVRGCGGADWSMEDQSITIYTHGKYSITDYILLMLHELGHHLDWIYNNKKQSKKELIAQEKLCAGKMYGKRPDLSKSIRRTILNSELAGISYMEIIHKELNLHIPLWKVKMQQELDAFDYKMLYNKGRFSTGKEFKEYRKSIKDFYKEKYG